MRLAARRPEAAPWLWPALVVILAGVSAAFHVAKLAPAIPALRASLGLTLVQSGFLLSTVQLAGLLLGAVMGGMADAWGLRRCLLLGLTLLSLASLLAPLSPSFGLLLLLRAVEGMGFLLASMPAAALLRRLVPLAQLPPILGLWGSYMPLATSLALLMGPYWIPVGGWGAWWWLAAVCTTAMGFGVWRKVPADPPRTDRAAHGLPQLLGRLRFTLSDRGPWLVALGFAVYSGQWLAIVGFLPAIYTQAGVGLALGALLTSGVAAVNMLGNMVSGVLQQRGVRPATLMAVGYTTMALGACLAFQAWWPIAPLLRFVGVLLFSLIGGVIPGTLFVLSVRLAPDEASISTTVGWMQQCSSLGQFLGPPLVGALAGAVGGWQWTWGFNALCSLLGLGVCAALRRQPMRR